MTKAERLYLKPQRQLFDCLSMVGSEGDLRAEGLRARLPNLSLDIGWREAFIVDRALVQAGAAANPALRSWLFDAICNSPDLPESWLGETLVIHLLRDRLGCTEQIWQLSGSEFDWSDPDSFVLWASATVGVLAGITSPLELARRLAQRSCTLLFAGDRAHAALDLLALRGIVRTAPSSISVEDLLLIERFASQAVSYLSASLAAIPSFEVRWYVDQLHE